MANKRGFWAYAEGGDELGWPVETRDLVRDLFASQRLAVLATMGSGQPYTSLVAFCEADDLRCLLFATNRSTRKYANLAASRQVAMLIDSRSNDESDFVKATAATAIGRAEEVQGDERGRVLGMYLARHPHLADFATAPDTAIVRVKVDHYRIVTGLQTVTELHMGHSSG